ncbi:hypothetical protein ABW20_dc0107906 [Dactylellina cionopaga]|nr:hypothetical protein ABW20_dc0107906 [Dactylellina cionopaga]
MADISEFTSVFRARVNLNDKRKANKRNRQALSCLACRSRKLKCDRQHPCTACSKRGEGSACIFTPTTGTAGNSGLSGSNGISKPSNTSVADVKRSEAQAKLQKLEELVQQLIQSGAVVPRPDNTQNTTAQRNIINREPIEQLDNEHEEEEEEEVGNRESPQDDPNPENTPPVFMCYNKSSGGYVGATHWAALLDQISGVREALEEATEVDTSDMTSHLTISDDHPGTDDADLILGTHSGHLSIDDAIRALPPRHIADRLLQIYYSVKFSNALFIHTTKFRREYEAFWKNPSSASLIWLSVLYSILCMGSMIATRGGRLVALESYDAEAVKLSSKARQCLVAGQHTKCQPYVIEALIIYAYCKYQLNIDADSTLWALTGYVTRLAQRLGYHRDPTQLSMKFTPLEAEMRRRTWFWVSTFDLVFSFQYGMPGIIHDEQCDTQAPGNFADEDFDEDTTVMPEPRPQSEFTTMLYYCHKIQMMGVFRKVIKQALALKQPEYEEILKLDKELEEVHISIPPVIRMEGSIRDSSFADASYMILHRLVLELTYHKCICVLHRTYLTFEKGNPKYDYSRAKARDSAMRILDLQSDAYDESQPGGRLWDERWMITSLTLHDFLLASMIMCLDLSEKRAGDSCIPCLNALRKSYKIWSEKKHMSRDAYHASNVLGAMLARVANENNAIGRTDTPIPTATNLTASGFASRFANWSSNPTNSSPLDRSRDGPTLHPTTSSDAQPTLVINVLGTNSHHNTGFGRAPFGSSEVPTFNTNNLGNDIVGTAETPYQDRSEQPGEFVPRQLTSREEMFGMGFGNDVYPMVDAFEPLDLDTMMGDGGNLDWVI